jgi:hypothetical protein
MQRRMTPLGFKPVEKEIAMGATRPPIQLKHE